MAEAVLNPVEQDDQLQDDTPGTRFAEWVRTELVWYAGSFTIHLLGLSLLLLLPTALMPSEDDSPKLDAANVDKVDNEKQMTFKNPDLTDPDEEQPTELNVDPTVEKPGHEAVTEDIIDDNPIYKPQGGGTPTGSKNMTGGSGFDAIAYGPGAKVTGSGGVGMGLGLGDKWGSGGAGTGFGDRGQGSRKAMLAAYGGTIHTERAVTGALVWLANHQNADGSWGLQNYVKHCHDQTCTGPGNVHADAGATAMGLLPFLAAGQTHKTPGYYRGNVTNAINWLVRHQEKDGNLAKDCDEPMYSHGLATIALCEAYGLSSDTNIGRVAQGAVNYVINAQNQGTGGWRYHPGEDGDTSVVGWQIMALKSAAMAGLGSGSSFGGASKWLDSVQSGPYNSQYAYQPGNNQSNAMTSVGLLCRQYLGANKRESPMMTEGAKYLLANLPDAQMPNIYYWYYASQVMHNMSGYEWDQWNRKMRKILVDTQCKDKNTCANGSWDPASDLWGQRGGRVMQTGLSALTLEIYYRYLPLFQEKAGAGGAGGAVGFQAPAKAEKADAAKAEGDKADAATPDAATPDAATPDAVTPDAAKPDAAKPDKAPAAE
jgi:hypothetical protein